MWIGKKNDVLNVKQFWSERRRVEVRWIGVIAAEELFLQRSREFLKEVLGVAKVRLVNPSGL